jgi:hypothetical protein
MEKSSWSFSPWPAQPCTDPRYCARASVANGWDPPVSSLFPQFPSSARRVATLAELPPTSRPPVTTPRHKDSRVFACHLEPSHQLQCTVASHHRCSPASVLVGTALVKLSLPNVCRGGHCLALPARVRSRVDRVY